jgi:hypothetical protein
MSPDMVFKHLRLSPTGTNEDKNPHLDLKMAAPTDHNLLFSPSDRMNMKMMTSRGDIQLNIGSKLWWDLVCLMYSKWFSEVREREDTYKIYHRPSCS